jgi:hypothetical protein
VVVPAGSPAAYIYTKEFQLDFRLEKELLSLAWVFKKWVEAVVLS